MIQRRSEIRLSPRSRGLHRIDQEIAAGVDLQGVGVGTLHLFLLHTSAGLTLNESVSPEVAQDLDRWLRSVVPDAWPAFQHRSEGPDDMPAHVVSSLLGASLTLPVHEGRLTLGRWQGVFLVEGRERGGVRTLVATVSGIP